MELRKAVDNYEAVLERGDDPMLIRHALFGLARAHESLRELDEAKDRYQELAEKFPDSSLAAVAKRQIEFISRPSTREFLSWLSKQDFEPARMTPPPGAGGLPPSPGGDGTSAREDPLLNLPTFTDPLGLGGAAAGQPDDEQSTTEDPAAPESARDVDSDEAQSSAPDSPAKPSETDDAAASGTADTAEQTDDGVETERPKSAGDPDEAPSGTAPDDAAAPEHTQADQSSAAPASSDERVPETASDAKDSADPGSENP
jgi:hypothetical protein